MCGRGGPIIYIGFWKIVFLFCHIVSVKQQFFLSCSMMKRQYEHVLYNHDNNKVTPKDECQKLKFSAVMRLMQFL